MFASQGSVPYSEQLTSEIIIVAAANLTGHGHNHGGSIEQSGALYGQTFSQVLSLLTTNRTSLTSGFALAISSSIGWTQSGTSKAILLYHSSYINARLSDVQKTSLIGPLFYLAYSAGLGQSISEAFAMVGYVAMLVASCQNLEISRITRLDVVECNEKSIPNYTHLQAWLMLLQAVARSSLNVCVEKNISGTSQNSNSECSISALLQIQQGSEDGLIPLPAMALSLYYAANVGTVTVDPPQDGTVRAAAVSVFGATPLSLQQAEGVLKLVHWHKVLSACLEASEHVGM